MAEIQQILDLWRRFKAAGEPAVLATVVKTQGSSYRVPGARLLIGRSGQKAGSVSGGCLEEDLLKKSWWLTANGPVLRRYDTTPEGDLGREEPGTGGFGLGCNGIIHVLLERLSPSEAGPLDWIEKVHLERRPAALCHLLGVARAGERILIRADEGISHNLKDSSLIEPAREIAAKAIKAGVSHHTALKSCELFVETLTPPVRLMVFGAGDDAVPLVRLAAFLGWRTQVFDSRSHYARPEKFPDADAVCVRAPGAALPTIDRWTVAVLMTHSYSQDLDALRALAADPPRYIGILGPRKRTDSLLADARLERSVFRDALYGPTGLDIGADGAHQVALAAIAEIQAVLNQRSGGNLRDIRTSIHVVNGGTESNTSQTYVGSIVCA